MKQRQPLSNEQKVVLDVLEIIKNGFTTGSRGIIDEQEFFELSKTIKEFYGIKESCEAKEEYRTLRQYIEDNSYWVRHTFIFEIYHKEINVCSVSEFSVIYRKELLDMFYVIEDSIEEHGDNWTNRCCIHHLTLAPKED